MLLTFAKVLKYLWPFLKESMLQGGTVGTWLLRNIITCIWILLLLTMLGVVLYMGDMASQLQARMMVISQEKAQVDTKNVALETKVASLRAKLAAERTKSKDLETAIQSYGDWLKGCGLAVPALTGLSGVKCPILHKNTPTFSRAPVKKPTHHTTPPPKPADEEEKQSLKDRLKAILGIKPESK